MLYQLSYASLSVSYGWNPVVQFVHFWGILWVPQSRTAAIPQLQLHPAELVPE